MQKVGLRELGTVQGSEVLEFCTSGIKFFAKELKSQN